MKRATNLALIRWRLTYLTLSRLGLFWGVGWAILSIIPAIAIWSLDPTPDPFSRLAIWSATVFGVWGGISGVGCGTLLTTVLREERITDFSVAKVSFWAAVAGALIPVVFLLAINGRDGMPNIVLMAAATSGAVLSGASAALTLTIAKRAQVAAPREPHHLP